MIFLLLALALVWGVLVMLAEVQALKDQVAASVASNARAKASLVALTAKLAAAQANAASDEDKAVLVQAVTDLKASEADLVSAVPA